MREIREDSELVVFSTDKSNRLAADSVSNYEKALQELPQPNSSGLGLYPSGDVLRSLSNTLSELGFGVECNCSMTCLAGVLRRLMIQTMKVLHLLQHKEQASIFSLTYFLLYSYVRILLTIYVVGWRRMVIP